MTKEITLSTLVSKGACEKQVLLFKRLLGDSAVPTREMCVKYAKDFEWDWAASNLLSAPSCKAYYDALAQAQKAYYGAVAQARKSYYDALAQAWFEGWNSEHD